jgi:hypothetical protein
MTIGPHPDDDLPVFDAPEPGAPRPGGRRPAGRGRLGPARGIGLAAAALVLLVAGIALGDLPDPARATDPPRPTSTPATTAGLPQRTFDPAEYATACRLAPASEVETQLRLRVDGAGDAPGQAGLDERGIPWRVPEVGDAVRADPAAVLVLVTNPGACLTSVAIGAVRTADVPGPASIDLRRQSFDPATSVVAIPGQPDGDWILRVTAQFDSLDDAPDPTIVTYFRLISGLGAAASDAPTRTAGTGTATDEPCRPPPPDGSTVEVTLTDLAGSQRSGPATTGIVPGSDLPVASIALGDTGLVELLGGFCATAWQIEVTEAVGGSTVAEQVFDGSGGVPPGAGRTWRIDPGVGTFNLVAYLEIGTDSLVVRAWRVVENSFVVPAARLTGVAGGSASMLPGCGLLVSLANGYENREACPTIGYPAGLEVLRVPAWSPVTLEIPGWDILTWSGECGSLGPNDSGTEVFLADECTLGSYDIDPGAQPRAPVRFLVRPAPHVVRISVTAQRAGDRFTAILYGLVDGE